MAKVKDPLPEVASETAVCADWGCSIDRLREFVLDHGLPVVRIPLESSAVVRDEDGRLVEYALPSGELRVQHESLGVLSEVVTDAHEFDSEPFGGRWYRRDDLQAFVATHPELFVADEPAREAWTGMIPSAPMKEAVDPPASEPAPTMGAHPPTTAAPSAGPTGNPGREDDLREYLASWLELHKGKPTCTLARWVKDTAKDFGDRSGERSAYFIPEQRRRAIADRFIRPDAESKPGPKPKG